jgi:hypothetical protein
MDLKTQWLRTVNALGGRQTFYLTILLGIFGWVIIFFNIDYVTSTLPRYAAF